MSATIRSAVMGIVVCGFLGLASSAFAGDKTGYLSLSGGGNFPSGDLDKSDITDSDTGAAIPDYSISLDPGWDVSVGVGAYVEQFRLELQYTAQSNDFDKFKHSDGSEESGSGRLHSNLFMFNGYYDIPLADRLSLYLGGGVGALYVTHEGDSAGHNISHQRGASFAYEAMLGVEYQVSPITSVFAGYRGWSALDLDTQQSTLNLPWFHMVEVGLRISL